MNQPIDILSLNHLLIYFVIGKIFKNNYTLALTLSLLWETVEKYIVNNKYTRNLLEKYWFVPKKYWDETHKLNPYFDILFNMIGYHIGNKS